MGEESGVPVLSTLRGCLHILASRIHSDFSSREQVSGLSSLAGPSLSFVVQGLKALLWLDHASGDFPHLRAASLPPCPGSSLQESPGQGRRLVRSLSRSAA